MGLNETISSVLLVAVVALLVLIYRRLAAIITRLNRAYLLASDVDRTPAEIDAELHSGLRL